MANHIGNDGLVKIGSATVAEVIGYSLSIKSNVADDTVLGDTYMTHVAGTKSWDGSIDCYWDETDTSGQVAMTIGASVTLHLLPEGATTGDTDWTGTATITGISNSIKQDSIVTQSFTFQGNGALTIGTAA